MAQTISTNPPLNALRMATIAYLDTGTVAAYTFTLGFIPRYVRLLNITGGVILEWVEGMTDAHGVKVKDNGDGTADLILLTSNGVTPTDDGFTMGLDTDLNVTSEQVYGVAFG